MTVKSDALSNAKDGGKAKKTAFNTETINNSKPFYSVNNLVKIAVLSAIAAVLQQIKIGGLPLAMPWLELEMSDLPAMLAAFGIGPVAGIVVELLKNVIKLSTTSTAGVGELSNFILGACMVAPAGFIYRFRRDRYGAMIGLIAGICMFCVAAIFVNIFVILPLYATLFMGSADKLLEIAKAVFPSINSFAGIAIIGTTPFNILKGVLVAFTTMLLYKPLSVVLKR